MTKKIKTTRRSFIAGTTAAAGKGPGMACALDDGSGSCLAFLGRDTSTPARRARARTVPVAPAP